MSNQLQENLNLILKEKNEKLLPENLKAGITCLGVTGMYGSNDLDFVGTTVTVEVAKSVNKGETWEGVLSENADYSCGTQKINAPNSSTKFSKDLSVCVESKYSITKDATTLEIYLYNTESASYEACSVDISGVSRTHALPAQYVSEDGSLIIFQFSNNDTTKSGMIVEVDKIHKTASAYMCNFAVMNGGSSTLWLNNFGAGYKDGKLYHYKYDTVTHDMVLLRTESKNGSLTKPRDVAKISDNIYLGLSGTTLYKYVIEADGIHVTNGSLTDYPDASYGRMSYDGKYISIKNTLYEINVADLTLSLISDNLGIGDITSYPFAGGKLLANSSLYDISGVSPEHPSATLLYTHSSDISPMSSNYSYYDIYGKYVDINFNAVYFPMNRTAQYVVEPATGNVTESGKFYGVASKTLNLGDIDTAQLLYRGGESATGKTPTCIQTEDGQLQNVAILSQGYKDVVLDDDVDDEYEGDVIGVTGKIIGCMINDEEFTLTIDFKRDGGFLVGGGDVIMAVKFYDDNGNEIPELSMYDLPVEGGDALVAFEGRVTPTFILTSPLDWERTIQSATSYKLYFTSF